MNPDLTPMGDFQNCMMYARMWTAKMWRHIKFGVSFTALFWTALAVSIWFGYRDWIWWVQAMHTLTLMLIAFMCGYNYYGWWQARGHARRWQDHAQRHLAQADPLDRLWQAGGEAPEHERLPRRD